MYLVPCCWVFVSYLLCPSHPTFFLFTRARGFCKMYHRRVLTGWRPRLEFEGVLAAIEPSPHVHVSVRYCLDHRDHELDDVGQVRHSAPSLALCRCCFFQSAVWYYRMGLWKRDLLSFFLQSVQSRGAQIRAGREPTTMSRDLRFSSRVHNAFVNPPR